MGLVEDANGFVVAWEAYKDEYDLDPESMIEVKEVDQLLHELRLVEAQALIKTDPVPDPGLQAAWEEFCEAGVIDKAKDGAS